MNPDKPKPSFAQVSRMRRFYEKKYPNIWYYWIYKKRLFWWHAYYRANHNEMSFSGHAKWIAK